MLRAPLAAALLVTAFVLPGPTLLAAPLPAGTAQGEPLDREGQRPRRTVSGYPGFRLSDWQIGGTASWTAEGDPPAGDPDAPPPPFLMGPEPSGRHVIPEPPRPGR